MSEFFSFSRFINEIPLILPYLKTSLLMLLACTVFGTVLGIFVALLNLKKVPVIHQILMVYISFMRGTPLLVQMMIVFYGLPLLIQAISGININRWDTVIFVDIAIILNEGAFLGEIFRGSILSIDPVQTEAALTVGMTRGQAYRRIILPQAVRIAIPPYGNDIVGVFKNTSLAYCLGVIDLMGRAKTIGTATGHAIEAFIIVTVIYIVFSLILRLFFNVLDKKGSSGRERCV